MKKIAELLCTGLLTGRTQVSVRTEVVEKSYIVPKVVTPFGILAEKVVETYSVEVHDFGAFTVESELLLSTYVKLLVL